MQSSGLRGVGDGLDPGDDQVHQPERNGMHGAADDEQRNVGVGKLQNVARQRRNDHAAHGARRSADSHHRSNVALGENVGSQRKDVGGPALVGGSGNRNQRQRQPDFSGQNSSNTGRHAEGADGHGGLAACVHAPAPPHQESGKPTAAHAADVCSDKGDGAKPRKLFNAESARLHQVLGQPKDVEPPDRIGEKLASNKAPRLPVAKQPAPFDFCLGLLFLTRLAQFNLLQFFQRQPAMQSGCLIERQPHHHDAQREQFR